jgi:hypothetical protein
MCAIRAGCGGGGEERPSPSWLTRALGRPGGLDVEASEEGFQIDFEAIEDRGST